MKYAALAAGALIATVSAACPEKVTIKAFDDKKCTNENASSEQLQQDWDFLARIFNSGCYAVGDKFMKWECTDASISANIYKEDTCTTQEFVATEHPLKKEFKWGACTQYGTLWV